MADGALGALTAALADRYAIEREIGAGGMATVYLARDLKHDRRVALKVLKPELGAVLGVERFLSEIKVTANLQHPNLLPLFDSGEAGGMLFYVMPYVEGETLRARLEREKQLPVDDAVRIASAIASALAYAHAQGVIHRDLKPENILMQAGQPVIADFGIALAVSNAGGARVTQTGLSLGTPQYMSPEQATGDRAIDGRTDIYSLGAMTYEMLVGDPPHTASTAQAIVAKVLTEKPSSVQTSRPAVSDEVAYAVQKALEKLPADRWSTAQAFAEALQGHSGTGNVTTARHARGVPVTRWSVKASPLPWMVAFVVAVVVAVLGWMRGAPAASAEVIRFELSAPAGAQFSAAIGGVTSYFAISPDGKRVVFTANRASGQPLFWLREIGSLTAQPIPGTEYADNPAFSPDGKWIAFSAPDGMLKKIGIDGGSLTTLCELGAAGSIGITWLSDHEIAFAKWNIADHGLWRVSADGGVARLITAKERVGSERQQAEPRAIAGGRLLLYSSSESTNNTRIAVADVATGKTVIFKSLAGAQALGVLRGHLIYVRGDGALMAAPFDERALTVGPPVQILDSIAVSRQEVGAALSESGTLLYQRGGGSSQLVTVDEHGAVRVLVDSVRAYAHPRLSPDGKRIAFEVRGPSDAQVSVYDLVAHTVERLTRDGSNDRPEWSPDGKRVMYPSTRGDTTALWWKAADGSGPETRVQTHTYPIREGALTPDGKSVVFRVDTDTSNRDVFMASLAGDHTPVPLLVSRADEKEPRISPDSKWLAYVSDESGREEVYVRTLAPGGGRVPVSAGGGGEPLWSADGRRLFYRHGSKLMAATIATSPTLSVTKRDDIFDIAFATDPYHPNYDVFADGKRFVMVQPLESSRSTVIVVNFVEELKRRVGAKQ